MEAKNAVNRFWVSWRLYHLIKKVLNAVVHLTREAEDAHGDEVDASRENSRLNHAQEETGGEDSRVVLHETLSDIDAPENDHAPGD